MSERIRSAVSAGVCAMACVAALPASAQARSYDIVAGSMRAALDAWSRQSGREIVYRSQDLNGLRFRGLRARVTADQALSTILSGSGLSARTDASGATAIVRGAGPTAAPRPAAAPTVQEALTDDGLQDILVTARRTEERSQRVPVSITAFSQDNIREKGITSGTELQNFTPSLSVLGDVARNQETYSIRGMGGGGGPGTGSGPGVVGYFAEVPSSVSGPGNFYDLASLQVLKGPQGTLFGRNTTGGAVLMEPARPKMNEAEGYVDVTLGRFARRSAQGAINIPLVDDVLAFRFAGQVDKRDGYVIDDVNGRDYLNRNNFSLRFGIQFNPAPNFSTYTALSYVDVNENGGGSVLLAVNPLRTYAALLQPYLAQQQARGVRRTALSVPTREIAKSLLILNNSEWRVSDTFSVKNIFSYARTRGTSATDRDSTPLPIADLLGAYPGSYNNNLRTITEELQVRYDDGTLRLMG